MSKKTRSPRKLPLQGVRVLVGRARHQAGALAAELRKLDATVIEIPFIEIRKPKSFKSLDAALKNLSSYDWLILTSVNGVDAMWERMEKLRISFSRVTRGGRDPSALLRTGLTGATVEPALKGRDFSRAVKRNDRRAALAAGASLRIAAIGPATKKAIEKRGVKVDVVPKEYVAESVVRSLRRRVKGKRVLLVRAKVARDVIPVELRKAGAQVDVVEAYETVVPESSRTRLRALLKNSQRRPHVITFTSSSTVRNFMALIGARTKLADEIKFASIGPVTSSTLRELGMPVDIVAGEFTIPGLVKAIVKAMGDAEARL